jgi:hypothetical protein
MFDIVVGVPRGDATYDACGVCDGDGQVCVCAMCGALLMCNRICVVVQSCIKVPPERDPCLPRLSPKVSSAGCRVVCSSLNLLALWSGAMRTGCWRRVRCALPA